MSKEEVRLKKDLEALQADFSRLLKDVKGLGNNGRSEISDYTSMATEQLGDLIHKAEASLEKMREQVKATSKRVESTVEEHPIAALLAALGIGFLLGKLISLSKE